MEIVTLAIKASGDRISLLLAVKRQCRLVMAENDDEVWRLLHTVTILSHHLVSHSAFGPLTGDHAESVDRLSEN